MDKIIAVIMQDNAHREQAQFQTYPRPSINPINQMITSPAEADKIVAASEQEVEEIMAIAFPSGTKPLIAAANSATTQTAHSAPPTATTAMTVTMAADHLDCRKPQRPASPSFTMNAITENHQGTTANPLLTVNTGNDGNMNSFITLTLATSHPNCRDNQNTVEFHNQKPISASTQASRDSEPGTNRNHSNQPP